MNAKRHSSSIAVLGVCSLTLLSLPANLPHVSSRASEKAAVIAAGANRPRTPQVYGKLPLRFELNRGQTDGQVKFFSRGSSCTLFLTSTDAVLALRTPASKQPQDSLRRTRSAVPTISSHQLREFRHDTAASEALYIDFVGANPALAVSGVNELPGRANYFIGNDPQKWRTNIPTYAEVKYRNIYPGVDLLFYGSQQELEHDFVVAPGANPKAIVLGFENARGLGINGQGDLIVHTSKGEMSLRKPQIYQEAGGARQMVAGNYVLEGNQRVGFELGKYDPAEPLIIDPVLSYSTYLGGSNDDLANAIAVDSSRDVYVAGQTASINFPTTPLARFASAPGGAEDAFVTKIDATKSGAASIIYSTYLGGSGSDFGFGIGVDSLGNAYVTGQTNSSNFPTTTTPVQSAFGGGMSDGFVTKLDPTGANLLYSTYFGGNGDDAGFGMAVDSSGHAYVVGVSGNSNSNNLPIRNGRWLH